MPLECIHYLIQKTHSNNTLSQTLRCLVAIVSRYWPSTARPFVAWWQSPQSTVHSLTIQVFHCEKAKLPHLSVPISANIQEQIPDQNCDQVPELASHEDVPSNLSLQQWDGVLGESFPGPKTPSACLILLEARRQVTNPHGALWAIEVKAEVCSHHSPWWHTVRNSTTGQQKNTGRTKWSAWLRQHNWTQCLGLCFITNHRSPHDVILHLFHKPLLLELECSRIQLFKECNGSKINSLSHNHL